MKQITLTSDTAPKRVEDTVYFQNMKSVSGSKRELEECLRTGEPVELIAVDFLVSYKGYVTKFNDNGLGMHIELLLA